MAAKRLAAELRAGFARLSDLMRRCIAMNRVGLTLAFRWGTVIIEVPRQPGGML